MPLNKIQKQMLDDKFIQDIGETSNLQTQKKNSLVDAINENVSLLAQNAKKLVGTTSLEEYESFAVKDANGTVTDWSPSIEKAIEDGFRNIETKNNYYTFRKPISIPYNSGIRIFARSGLKKTIFNVFMESGNEERGFIEYLTNANGEHNFAGLRLENIHIKGNNSMCHGVYIQYAAYLSFDNVLIEGFNGAGLLLDKCQDSTFDGLSIQRCGRTSGDSTNNADTVYSPLHLVSTMTGDSNNMLRFRNPQIEQNNVSPYIWYKDTGGIGIVFENIHAEIREPEDWYKWDFFLAEGGDFIIRGSNVDKFREGWIHNGYGKMSFSNNRNIGTLKHTKPNVSFFFEVNQSNVESLSYTAISGRSKFTDMSITGNVTIDYPAGDEDVFTNAKVGDVIISNSGAGFAGVKFLNCILNSYKTTATAKNQSLKDSRVVGNLEARATLSIVENVEYGALIFVNTIESSYIPKKKIVYTTSKPTSGNWSTGDRVINPNPATGDVLEWTCVTSGSPGTWVMTKQAGYRFNSTANRPSLTSSERGYMYFDSTLSSNGKLIIWSGTAWVDSTGSLV